MCVCVGGISPPSNVFLCLQEMFTLNLFPHNHQSRYSYDSYGLYAQKCLGMIGSENACVCLSVCVHTQVHIYARVCTHTHTYLPANFDLHLFTGIKLNPFSLSFLKHSVSPIVLGFSI